MKNNSRHAPLLTDFSSDASWLVNCPFRALSSFRLPIQLLVYFRETVWVIISFTTASNESDFHGLQEKIDIEKG